MSGCSFEEDKTMETTKHNHSPVGFVIHLLRYLLPGVALVCIAGPSVAAPQIFIEFQQEPGSGKEWIHAKANCHTTEPQLNEVINTVVKYPALHSWIRDTKFENETSDGGQQFLIEFRFPWPVGKRWSRVEVKREGDSVISWVQLEGTLNMNQGRIVITEHEQQAHIDYRAVIDVGYPNVVTRSYKKQFVMEFLGAIYDQTRNSHQLANLNP